MVNENGSYGTWTWDVAFNPSDIRGIIDKHFQSTVSAKEYAKCPKCGKSVQTKQEIEAEFGFSQYGWHDQATVMVQKM